MPFLAQNKLEIEKNVLSYLGRILPQIKLENFTIDVGMCSNGTLCVVEINPPAPRSGTSLFEWNHGTAASKCDNNILLGLEPFEFRVLHEPIDEKKLLDDRKQTFEHFKVLGIEMDEQEEAKCCLN